MPVFSMILGILFMLLAATLAATIAPKEKRGNAFLVVFLAIASISSTIAMTRVMIKAEIREVKEEVQRLSVSVDTHR